MDYINAIGLVAATFTVISLLPQLWKVWKTKSTKDISTGMFALYCTGLFVWFSYGLLIKSEPIIIANLLAFVQAMLILAFKIKYK